MKKLFNNLALKMSKFMYGRYGFDKLWKVFLICYIVLIIIANIVYRFSRVSYYAVSVMAFVLLGFGIYRALSKNIEARRSEYNSYLKFEWKVKSRFKLTKNKWQQRKTHKFVKCKKCKKVLRLPKHKGKINVTCPTCGEQFIVNTGKKK